MLGIYSHDAERMRAESRAVNRFRPSAAVVLPSAVAVSRRAPHPGPPCFSTTNMLTDGQRCYTEGARVPANKNYDTRCAPGARGPGCQIVNAKEAIDGLRKMARRVQRLIVDRRSTNPHGTEDARPVRCEERRPPVTRDYLGREHPVHAEQLFRIGPTFSGVNPAACQFLELGDRVLAGNLRMDGFAGREIEPPAADVRELRVQALQVHLDAALIGS